MSVRSKNIYEAPAPEDGRRLLVMRKWPRGIAKSQVDAWEKELGPSLALLEEWRGGEISWAEFARRYIQEVTSQPHLLQDIANRARTQTVTVLCGCRDDNTCHRTLLQGIITSYFAQDRG